MLDVTPFYNPFKTVEKTADGYNIIRFEKNGKTYKKKERKTERIKCVK